MPVIEFSVGDILRNKVLDKGWRSFILSCEGPVANSKKDGVNYVVTFKLIDAGPELDGKELVRYFSSKAMSMMLPLVAAVRGITMAEIEKK